MCVFGGRANAPQADYPLHAANPPAEEGPAR